MPSTEFQLRSLSEIAGVRQRHLFVEPEHYTRRAPTRIYTCDAQGEAFLPFFSKLQGRLPAQALYEMPPNLIVQDKGTMRVGQDVVRENMEAAPVARILEALQKNAPEVARVIDEPVLYTSRYGVKNYGHCLMDIAPRVVWALRVQPSLKIALHPEFVPSVMELMLDMGVPRASLIQLDERPTLLRQGFFASPCNANPLVHSPAAIAELRTASPLLVKKAKSMEGLPHNSRIFVTRADAKTRHLKNHVAVARALRARGFEEVTTGTRPQAWQAALFEQADEVVAIAGASATNLIYCRPGTRVTLLSPSSMSSLYFWDLATQLDLDFRMGYFPPANPERGIHADFSADPNEVLGLLNA